MRRWLPDLEGSLEWNLVARDDITALNRVPLWQRYDRYRRRIQNSNVLAIGVQAANARPNWRTGGWATQLQIIRVDSFTNFGNLVATERQRLRLGLLNLCVFPQSLSDWTLDLIIPYWFNQVYIEIWSYDGRDKADYEFGLEISEKVDSLLAR